MKLLLATLLFAISYAQTGSSAVGGSNPYNNMYNYGMMEEMYDGMGDMYENGGMYGMGGGMGGTGMSPYIQNYAPQVSNFMTQNPYMGEYVKDIYEDLQDMGMGAGMGMQGGIQNLIPQVMSMFSGQGGMNPYMMGGDGMGDMKDLMKDVYKMQGAAQMMSGYGRSSGSPSSGSPSSSGASNPSYRPSMKLQQRRQPSRLLHPSHKLQKPREFPWYMLQQFGQQLGQQTGGNNNFGSMMGGLAGMFGYDGMDSEDRAMAIAMGANPRNLPPPTDGVDSGDRWMFPQLFPQYNRQAGASTSSGTTTATATGATAGSSTTASTASTGTASTGTQSNNDNNMGYYNYQNMWPWWSSLQKRHMKY